MSYEVLARKWRPQQFDDVVGQEHVTQTLKNAIASDRIAHAYLFVGPRGIGKTSVARIFAKALNCQEGTSQNPCDKCDCCREIMTGTSLDVMEIDGASNNGVDQVRDLRETVKYAPTNAPYKIYIIDEVHMLSTAAFNALLKTLEEPPAHVKFIFATTEPEKVLATVVSRCQRFDLRRIPVPQIIQRLEIISKDEGVSIDQDALLAIARGAEGSLRDAESALDQLISFRGKSISEEDVLSVFGLVSRSALDDLAAKILDGDIRGLMSLVRQLDQAGKDLQRLVLELMEHFRNLLVFLHAKDDMDLAAIQVDTLESQAAGTDTERVLRIADILSGVEDRMKYALSRRTLLETALIRCARAATVVSIEDILAQLDVLKKNITVDGAGPVPSSPPAATPVPAVGRSSASESTPVQRPKVAKAIDLVADLESLLQKWDSIVARIGKIALAARGPLADGRPQNVSDDQVTIAFDPEFAGEVDNFDAPRNRKAVEHVLCSVLGREVTARFVVADVSPVNSQPTPDEKPAPSDVPAENAEEKPGKGPSAKKGVVVQNWLTDEAVQKTLEVFNGTIVDVRE